MILFQCLCLVLPLIQFNWANPVQEIIEYRNDVDEWLRKLNDDLLEFNQICTKITWDMMVYGGDEELRNKAKEIALARLIWKNKACNSEQNWELLTNYQLRQIHLLCRGPKFSAESLRNEMEGLSAMHAAYDLRVCFNASDPLTPLEKLRYPRQSIDNYPKPGDCLMAEPDLENLMKRQDLNANQLRWIWETFYDNIAFPMRQIFPQVVRSQNSVARANSYNDMGEIWREELEMPDIETRVQELYKEIEPLYKMLHAVTRHMLMKKFGKFVDPEGPIPIHLTGNMWGQNWSPLMDLFFHNHTLDLDARLKANKWTVQEMALQAEDFYMSLSLPPMTAKFWQYSVLEESENSTSCHGTAANMFNGDDYRILMCAKVNMDDFYVLHHEMGHIQYNMAYSHQAPIFREGVNSALHETIGDVIMHGVMVPQHLHRLSLINDGELQDPQVDLYLLLLQALSKLPEIAFGLIVDEYRWNIFNGNVQESDYNRIYWNMNKLIRGIKPPAERGEEFFDAGAKFHVPDNTPYIRYFLSSILQMQIFKGLCDVSLFGKFQAELGVEDEPLSVPLHRCDIYGCKTCGKLLKKAMSLGASIHWTQVLNILTGQDYLSTKPLLDYYLPVYEWLKEYVEANNVPIGW